MNRLYVVFAGGLVLTCGAPAFGQTVAAATPTVRLEHLGTLRGGTAPGDLFAPHSSGMDEGGFVAVVDSLGLATSPPSEVSPPGGCSCLTCNTVRRSD
jgi:hypothetical protein